MKYLLFIALILLSAVDAMSEQNLKKITVVNSNQDAQFLLRGDWIENDFEKKSLGALRNYVEKKGFKVAVGKNETEFEFVKSALKWVTEQWSHEGLNEPPLGYSALDILKSVHKRNARYRCVEYGLVLSEILRAYGFYTRKLAIRSKDVAYGGFGQGHVAMEVWINDLGKWVFLDPQFGAFFTKNSSVPLNFYELSVLKKMGEWKAAEVNFVSYANPTMPKDKLEAAEMYKSFLQQYFGFMTIGTISSGSEISLLMESEQPALTFQGFQQDPKLSTREFQLLYPQMGRAFISLKHESVKQTTAQVLKEFDIKTNEDFLAAMPKFAPKAKFKVHMLTHARDEVERFEYRYTSMDKWLSTNKNSFNWEAKPGLNRLEVRAVNKMGRSGPINFIELSYE